MNISITYLGLRVSRIVCTYLGIKETVVEQPTLLSVSFRFGFFFLFFDLALFDMQLSCAKVTCLCRINIKILEAL